MADDKRQPLLAGINANDGADPIAVVATEGCCIRSSSCSSTSSTKPRPCSSSLSPICADKCCTSQIVSTPATASTVSASAASLAPTHDNENGGGCRSKSSCQANGSASNRSSCCEKESAVLIKPSSINGRSRQSGCCNGQPQPPVQPPSACKSACCSGPRQSLPLSSAEPVCRDSCCGGASSTSANCSSTPSYYSAADDILCTLSWHSFALYLASFSLVWNFIEGGLGLWVGIQAVQLAVLANAGQSACEVVSALLVLWRLKAESRIRQEQKQRAEEVGETEENVDVDVENGHSNGATLQRNLLPSTSLVQSRLLDRERRGIRCMGCMFVCLSLAVVAGCILRLLARRGPEDTLPGLIISGVSGCVMLVLFLLKRKAARKIDSRTLMEDARCNLFCFQLCVTVLVGSGIGLMQKPVIDHWCSYAGCTLWWVDAGLAMAISCVIFRDGVRSLRLSYAKDFNGGCGCCSNSPS